MPSCLERDDGLDTGGRTQAAHEAPGIGDALDVHEDGARLGVGYQVIEIIAEVQVGPDPGRYDRGETDAVLISPVEDGRADCTGLRHEREVAWCCIVVTEGQVDADVGPDDTQAIGTHDPDLVPLRTPENFGLEAAARFPGFAKPCRENQHHSHAVFATFVHDRGNGLGGRRHHGKIDFLAGSCQRGERRTLQDLLVVRVDGHDRALEAGFEKIPVYDGADSV